jgi:8-oxo-dGTP pyrophosphatase MutT (NUDIX family)
MPMSHGEPTTSSAVDVPIRDAACVLVVDASGFEPKILMGRRRAEQVFLPNKWVFPGGRVEDDDRLLAQSFEEAFSPAGLAAEIKPFALAAVRELFEETGLMVGRRGTPSGPLGPAWQSFAASGCVPQPADLYPLARAITPPGRVRRFDTWFFLAGIDAVLNDSALPDGELLDLGWFTLPKARELDLPNITRLVLDDVAGVVGKARAVTDAGEPLPYYYSDGTAFRRDLISCKVAPPMP